MGTVVVGDPGAPVVAQSGDSDCLAGKLRAALGAVDDGIVAAGGGAGRGDLVLDHGLSGGMHVLLADDRGVGQLAQRGFLPELGRLLLIAALRVDDEVSTGGGETEVRISLIAAVLRVHRLDGVQAGIIKLQIMPEKRD